MTEPDPRRAPPARTSADAPEGATDAAPGWADRLFVGMQYLLPQHLLSALMYRFAPSPATSR